MELTETIESINSLLVDHFGKDTVTGLAMWRVVWSEDQYEHRLGTYDDFTPAGIYLRTVTEVRHVPKYKQWIKEKYVLENLVEIPIVNQQELPDSKISYEPIWVFQTGSGVYLPPKFEACKLIVDSIYATKGHKNLVKYKDPEAGLSKADQFEFQRDKIDKLQEELFGNETLVGDGLAHKMAIVVPRNFNKRVN